MSDYPFVFSVVMSVYNVQAYIREAIRSLEKQTIGFRHIQLILVDDGSTDSSGAICDEYAKRYPENVMVIHKENGGLSSARNVGLQHIRGELVNFLDPDDKLDHDVMAKVKRFMDAHGDVDLCCIPYEFFGHMSGPHPLNNKFDKGTRVIDLMQDENADCFLLSMATSFHRNESIRNVRFNTEIFASEDAIENLRLQIKKPRIGVVADCVYHYRKHGKSMLDQSRFRREWYTVYLEVYSKYILDLAEKQYGTIPRFVQMAVMYDLQWKLNQAHLPSAVLPGEDAAAYRDLLIATTCRMDTDVILSQKNMGLETKLFILQKKNKEPLKLQPVKRTEKALSEYDDLAYIAGSGTAGYVSELQTVLEFLTIDDSGTECTVEGYQIVYGLEGHSVHPYLDVNGRMIPCDKVERKKKNMVCLDTMIAEAIGFRASFSLDEKRSAVRPMLSVDGLPVPCNHLIFHQFFPVSNVYRNGYALMRGRMAVLSDNTIAVMKKPGFTARAVREGRLLAEIWKKNLLGGRKAVAGRLYYHLFKPFKRKALWIVSDRIMKADDNGEAFFRYLSEHKPKKTRVLFAISRKSPDYPRLRSIGKCVDAMSFRHKLLHLLCDVNISAQADAVTINPFSGYHDALRDLLLHQHFVFLQHGVTQDDISGWLNRYDKNMSGYITVSHQEERSILEGDYGYDQDVVWLTGFPRYDRLYRHEKKIVTVMPTWRRYLMAGLDSQTGLWTLQKDFFESGYCQFYEKLLNSERLLAALSTCGYSLQFLPHPNLRPLLSSFRHPDSVKLLTGSFSYRDVYAESSLVITDYSSSVFDFAYLQKPVIYCQFDKERFFAGDHVCKAGYFDYERDGFGEVAYDLDSTIDLIIDYVRHDCRLKDEYRDRIDHFFAFHDRDNARRVLDRILKLPSKC